MGHAPEQIEIDNDISIINQYHHLIWLLVDRAIQRELSGCVLAVYYGTRVPTKVLGQGFLVILFLALERFFTSSEPVYPKP